MNGGHVRKVKWMLRISKMNGSWSVDSKVDVILCFNMRNWMCLKIEGILPLPKLAFGYCCFWPSLRGQSLAAVVLCTWPSPPPLSSLFSDPGLCAFVLSLLNLSLVDLGYKLRDFHINQTCCRARWTSVSVAWLWHLFYVVANLLQILPCTDLGGILLGLRQSLKNLLIKYTF